MSSFTTQHKYCKSCLSHFLEVQIKDGIIQHACPNPQVNVCMYTDVLNYTYIYIYVILTSINSKRYAKATQQRQKSRHWYQRKFFESI